MNGWIATLDPPRDDERGAFPRGVLVPFAKNLHVTPPKNSLKLLVKFGPGQGCLPGEES